MLRMASAHSPVLGPFLFSGRFTLAARPLSAAGQTTSRGGLFNRCPGNASRSPGDSSERRRPRSALLGPLHSFKRNRTLRIRSE
jgi:hypothetical protein